MDRRDFLKTGAAVAAMLQTKNVMGSNDRVRVAIVGLRGRGNDHIKRAHAVPGVEIAAICDIDDNVLAQRLAEIEKLGVPKPKTYVGLPQTSGRQIYRRGVHRHAEPLAFADGNLGMPGRQGRLRRKTVLAQFLGRQATGRRRGKSTTGSCSTERNRRSSIGDSGSHAATCARV